MTIDVARARVDTPGVQNVLHFNNAGAGLMPTPVLNALTDHLKLESDIGGYEAAAKASNAIAATYTSIAKMLNAHPGEIALMENATMAWMSVFHAMVRTFAPGDKIITVEAEYASNYISYLQVARAHGLEIVVAPSDESGSVDLEALENLIDDRVRLISMTHVPTNGGLVNPAVAVGEIAKRAGVLYLLDACQSVGQLHLDVEKIGCDALSVTGRKYLRGPRGTGFLYVKQERIEELEPPFIDLHGGKWTESNNFELLKDAKRFENWEFYVAGILGLGVAVDYALDLGLKNIETRVTELAQKLRSQLSDIKGVSVTDIGHQKCGIVTFSVDGRGPDDVKATLAENNINVSTSTRYSTRLDMERRGLDVVVRSSVHYYNDENEIDRFCEAVAAI